MSTVRPHEPGITGSHTALARGTSQTHRDISADRHMQMYTLHRNICGYKHICRHILTLTSTDTQILKQTHLPTHRDNTRRHTWRYRYNHRDTHRETDTGTQALTHTHVHSHILDNNRYICYGHTCRYTNTYRHWHPHTSIHMVTILIHEDSTHSRHHE